MSYTKELDFAKKVAYDAGKVMRRYFKAEDIGTKWKQDDTPLTVADTKINAAVIEEVKQAFPEHGILGEEASFEPDRDMVWVVDPIDGTAPFSLDIPVSTFMMALVERKTGQPVLGVVYDPYLDHLFSAVEGKGAFLNDEPIQTSQTISLTKGYVSIYGQPVKTDVIDYVPGRVVDALRSQSTKNFTFASGGYTMTKIASGNFSAVVLGKPAEPWDVAAPCIIVREAGGIVTDLEGGSRKFNERGHGCVLAANQAVHQELLKLIKG